MGFGTSALWDWYWPLQWMCSKMVCMSFVFHQVLSLATLKDDIFSAASGEVVIEMTSFLFQ